MSTRFSYIYEADKETLKTIRFKPVECPDNEEIGNAAIYLPKAFLADTGYEKGDSLTLSISVN